MEQPSRFDIVAGYMIEIKKFIKDFEETQRSECEYANIEEYHWEVEESFKRFLRKYFDLIKLMFKTKTVMDIYRNCEGEVSCQITGSTINNFFESITFDEKTALLKSRKNRKSDPKEEPRRYIKRLYKTLVTFSDSMDEKKFMNDLYGINWNKVYDMILLGKISEKSEIVVYDINSRTIKTMNGYNERNCNIRYYYSIVNILNNFNMSEKERLREIIKVEADLFNLVQTFGIYSFLDGRSEKLEYCNIREAILSSSLEYYESRKSNFDEYAKMTGKVDMEYNSELDIFSSDIYRIGIFYGCYRR